MLVAVWNCARGEPFVPSILDDLADTIREKILARGPFQHACLDRDSSGELETLEYNHVHILSPDEAIELGDFVRLHYTSTDEWTLEIMADMRSRLHARHFWVDIAQAEGPRDYNHDTKYPYLLTYDDLLQQSDLHKGNLETS